MSKQEFAQYAMALKSFYPKEKILETSQAMELWYQQLKDMPYGLAQKRLLEWVKTNKWSPSISEILGHQKEAGIFSIGMEEFIGMIEEREDVFG